MDRYLITVQALITLAMLGFAWGMYSVIGGPAADTVGTLVVGGIMAHWFKESSAIGRSVVQKRQKTDVVNVEGDDVVVSERPA